MGLKQPSIDIIFRQKAFSFVQRSERGRVVLIIKDDTNKSFNMKEYKYITDLETDKGLYTPTNYQYIVDSFIGNPFKINVIRIDKDKTVSDALKFADSLKTGWIGFAEGTQADYDTLFTWVKQVNEKKHYTFMAAGFKPVSMPDNEYCHVLKNPKVTFKDDRKEQTTDKWIPTLLGIAAGSNVKKGLTKKVISNLKSVEQIEEVDEALNEGYLVLENDEEKVKIVLGNNSLTTLGTDKTEDFRFIEIIEAQNMIKDDIKKTFKDDFQGKYKNNYDNQLIFITAVNSYLKDLANEEVLDINYSNKVDIDVQKQRDMWGAVGQNVQEWDDIKVRNRTFKRDVYLSGNIKILFSMTDLKFNITMV